MSNSANYRFVAWEAGVDLAATGRQLREFRLRYNLTQERLSEVICNGCDYSASKNAISMWENGKKLLSLHHVVFLSELWHCRIDELVISYRRSREAADRDQPVPLKLHIFYKVSICVFVCSPFCIKKRNPKNATAGYRTILLPKSAKLALNLAEFCYRRAATSCNSNRFLLAAK